MNHVLINDDCLATLKELPDNSVDSLVTDPPAGIGFMGKEWDHHKGGRKEWCAWMESVMRECLRVMKPGAHGLVWALPRTSHWTATALEDAGFEIRDCVYHLFGSGFPKSLDVSKAIDKAAGVEGEIIGKNPAYRDKAYTWSGGQGETPMRPEFKRGPATDAAKQWAGWGTALKPAVECWWLVRKPCSEKTVAANVLKWGTGALNIDASRIAGSKPSVPQRDMRTVHGGKFGAHDGMGRSGEMSDASQGRFPANLLLSHSPHCTETQCDIECAIAMLDEQSGTLASGARAKGVRKGMGFHGATGDGGPAITQSSGGASRFFYCAKISSSERNAGLEGMPKRNSDVGDQRPSGTMSQRLHPDENRKEIPRANTHPTVKPQKLMRYLVTMVTPPGGVVLDPFMGSGSTGVAAISSEFQFIGIEKEAEYFQICEARIAVEEAKTTGVK